MKYHTLFFGKLGKISQNLSSAAVIIGALRFNGNGIAKSTCLTHLCQIFQSCQGEQWLSGRVLDSRPRGRGFEPHRRHCVVVLEQDKFILA